MKAPLLLVSLFTATDALPGKVGLITEWTQQQKGTSSNGSTEAETYDWNPGGGSIRNLFILGNNALFHINPEIHGFNTYYYGKGKLHF